ncbi:DUF4091 domain-containing protein [Sutcliffiella sp. NPDC057660]|uniref:DUF4091 domain-containing protein n=1 Tax=Sutcliffiella sp. NPDC057660 TaxID=3346199 RepID=UPI0036C01B4D
MFNKFETKCISSLAKVFAEKDLEEKNYSKASALRNEIFSFQVAYRNNGPLMKKVRVKSESVFGARLHFRTVGLVPSELPSYHDHDEWVLRSTPGLYPDPLYPINFTGITCLPNQWRSIWCTVELDESIEPGTYSILIKFETEDGEHLSRQSFDLTVLSETLPEQKLIHTEWFHTDCLAEHYRVEVFSEAHWDLIAKYMDTAVKHGINMILTPIFTPPLDTEVGGERPTVQLIDVSKRGDQYSFSFEKLGRWIQLSLDKGIRYFEMAHLFTQWGAAHAPKIIAVENGITKRIFGWETVASGEEYRNFLSQLLPALTNFIKEKGMENRVYFHISDEPRTEHLESYRRASEMVRVHLAEFPIIDALSDYDFYKNGLIEHPIPANNHLGPFLENHVSGLWTYYCCSQYKEVSNRFMNLPSARNRIIGMQLYKYNIQGFLHWGYNFWFSQLSKRKINPFQNTDADCSYPSGDAFLVYPGKDGPIESIRLEVFFEALQDLCALQLLEKKIGRDDVLELLERDSEKPLTFHEYPRSSEWILNKREEINQLIAQLSRI